MHLTPIHFNNSSDLLEFIAQIKQNPDLRIICSDTYDYFLIYDSVQPDVTEEIESNYIFLNNSGDSVSVQQLNNNPELIATIPTTKELHRLAKMLPEAFFGLETAPQLNSLEAIKAARSQINTTELNLCFQLLNMTTNMYSLVLNFSDGTLMQHDKMKIFIKPLFSKPLFHDISKIYFYKNKLLGSYLIAAMKNTNDEQQKQELFTWLQDLDSLIKDQIQSNNKRMELINKISTNLLKIKENHRKRIALDPGLTNTTLELEKLNQKLIKLNQKIEDKTSRNPRLKEIVFWSVLIGVPVLIEIAVIVLIALYAPPIVFSILILAVTVFDLALTFFPNILNPLIQPLERFKRTIDNYFDESLNEDHKAVYKLQIQISELNQITQYANSIEEYLALEESIKNQQQVLNTQMQQLEQAIQDIEITETSTNDQQPVKVSTLSVFAKPAVNASSPVAEERTYSINNN